MLSDHSVSIVENIFVFFKFLNTTEGQFIDEFILRIEQGTALFLSLRLLLSCRPSSVVLAKRSSSYWSRKIVLIFKSVNATEGHVVQLFVVKKYLYQFLPCGYQFSANAFLELLVPVTKVEKIVDFIHIFYPPKVGLLIFVFWRKIHIGLFPGVVNFVEKAF